MQEQTKNNKADFLNRHNLNLRCQTSLLRDRGACDLAQQLGTRFCFGNEWKSGSDVKERERESIGGRSCSLFAWRKTKEISALVEDDDDDDDGRDIASPSSPTPSSEICPAVDNLIQEINQAHANERLQSYKLYLLGPVPYCTPCPHNRVLSTDEHNPGERRTMYSTSYLSSHHSIGATARYDSGGATTPHYKIMPVNTPAVRSLPQLVHPRTGKQEGEKARERKGRKKKRDKQGQAREINNRASLLATRCRRRRRALRGLPASAIYLREARRRLSRVGACERER